MNLTLIGGKATTQDGNFILMQYTGLKDKNGREIYEGDIVKGRQLSGVEATMAVEFLDGLFNIADPHEVIYSGRDDGCEVIGNIYENKELLDDKK